MYSVNQVKQLYVVTGIKEPALNETVAVMETSDSVGTLVPKTSVDGWFQYFQYKGAKGDVIATDRIKKCKVKWVTFTEAEAMRKNKLVTTITLNSSDGATGGDPVIGQDYVINFSFRNYFGMSDEDIYEKYACARAMSDSASDLYRDLAISLAKNMSREVDKPFKIYLTESGESDQEVTVHSNANTLTPDSAFDGIKLVEEEQPWELGRMQQTRPNYEVHFVPIVSEGIETYTWGNESKSEVAANGYIKNGADTADFEWFCMGERGDQYRGKDWPLSITTPANLMVNSGQEYDYLTIHFWDDIPNEGPQKSERDMIFITSTSGSVDLEEIAKSVCQNSGLDHYTKTYMDSGTKTTTVVPVPSADMEAIDDRVEALEG